MASEWTVETEDTPPGVLVSRLRFSSIQCIRISTESAIEGNSNQTRPSLSIIWIAILNYDRLLKISAVNWNSWLPYRSSSNHREKNVQFEQFSWKSIESESEHNEMPFHFVRKHYIKTPFQCVKMVARILIALFIDKKQWTADLCLSVCYFVEPLETSCQAMMPGLVFAIRELCERGARRANQFASHIFFLQRRLCWHSSTSPSSLLLTRSRQYALREKLL